VVGICKRSSLIIFYSQILNFFRERKQWYFRERCYENIYVIENGNYELEVWRIHEVLYDSRVLSFYEEEVLECNFILILLIREKISYTNINRMETL
jgi:hypothetical protein